MAVLTLLLTTRAFFGKGHSHGVLFRHVLETFKPNNGYEPLGTTNPRGPIR